MKKNILIMLLCAFGCITAVEPYDSVTVLPYLPHGWLREENKIYLTKFIAELQPKVVIEVGTWLGLSAMLMANGLPKGSVLYI